MEIRSKGKVPEAVPSPVPTVPMVSGEGVAFVEAERGQPQSATADTPLQVVSGNARDDEIEPSEASTSSIEPKMDATRVLLSLPEPELRNLCKLLAREGYGSSVVTSAA